MLNGHGDDLYLSETEIKANFSTNVWYDSDADIIRSVVNTQINTIFHYPEPAAESFAKEVAVAHGLEPENVIAGNGATELFYLVAHAFEGAKTAIPVPSFREYEDACTMYKHDISFILMNEVPKTTSELMFICNPNNPDGYIWTPEQIMHFLQYYPNMTLVVDESFIHFAPSAQSCVPLLSDCPNLLIVNSMTKNHAIPGLRLGYMLGNKALIERIKAFKYPWSVNSLAIEVGKFLIRHEKYLLPDTGRLMKRKLVFVNKLNELPNFKALNSGSSFFLVHTGYDATELKQYLIEQHGILIREASNFRELDEHFFRVNTLSEEKNLMLVEALKVWNSNHNV